MYSRCKDHDLIDRIVQLRHGHRANKNWAALQTFMQIRRGLWKNSKVAGNAPINQLIQTMERSLVVFLFLLFFFCFLFFFSFYSTLRFFTQSTFSRINWNRSHSWIEKWTENVKSSLEDCKWILYDLWIFRN